MLFIEFSIIDNKKFQEFLKVYDIIRTVQTDSSSELQPLAFWQNVIPEYSKVNFSQKEKSSGRFPFEDMMNYLHHTLEVDYKDCQIMTPSTGKIELQALSYPYGGLDRLIYFLKTFALQANKVNAGFGEKNVIWKGEFDFYYEK